MDKVAILFCLQLIQTLFSLAKASAYGPGHFLLFSDAHIDPFYATDKAWKYQHDSPCKEKDAPPFSTYGCDSTKMLVESAIANAAFATSNPDFILFLGDATRHDVKHVGGAELANQTVQDTLSFVAENVRKYFPNIPIMSLPPLVSGNNDLSEDYILKITSTTPCFVQKDGSLPEATNDWLKRTADMHSLSFINELEAATYACGGYLMREIHDNLIIIVLNTVIWSTKLNRGIGGPPKDDFDPFGQHEWLYETLLHILKIGNKKVYITGHIPPVLESYTPKVGTTLLHNSHAEKFYSTVKKFQADVVSGILFGHLHANELRANGLSDLHPPTIISGAISPCYNSAPFFSIVSYDIRSKFPTNIYTFAASLDEHATFLTEKIIEFKPIFKNGLMDHFNLQQFTNSAVKNISSTMFFNDETWNFYWNIFNQGRPHIEPCDKICRLKQLCVISCGTTPDIWNECIQLDNHVHEHNIGGCALEKDVYSSLVVERVTLLLSYIGAFLFGMISLAVIVRITIKSRRKRKGAPIEQNEWEYVEEDNKDSDVKSLKSLNTIT